MLKSRRGRRASVRENVSFVEAMASLTSAFDDIAASMGQDQYERVLGFPYPACEVATLHSFLAKSASNDGV